VHDHILSQQTFYESMNYFESHEQFLNF
jgi:hypothetical protein